MEALKGRTLSAQAQSGPAWLLLHFPAESAEDLSALLLAFTELLGGGRLGVSGTSALRLSSIYSRGFYTRTPLSLKAWV